MGVGSHTNEIIFLCRLESVVSALVADEDDDSILESYFGDLKRSNGEAPQPQPNNVSR